jgi:hypothetical protein
MVHHALTPQRSRAEASGREVPTFKVTHRNTADGKNRRATVELLVEQTPIRRRASPVIGVQIAFAEKDLQARARAVGAMWDPSARLWKMPLKSLKSLEMLGLTERLHKLDQ